MTDYYAVDDEHALYLARQSIKNLNKIKDPQVTITAPREPLYDPEELYGIVGENLKKVRLELGVVHLHHVVTDIMSTVFNTCPTIFAPATIIHNA